MILSNKQSLQTSTKNVFSLNSDIHNSKTVWKENKIEKKEEKEEER